MATLTKLIGENFLGLKAVTIEPNGSTVIIGGENESGKTSTLKIAEAVFGGAKRAPAEPLRKGTKKGRVAADVADAFDMGPLHFERSITEKGLGQLKITSNEGAVLGGPQALANKLWSSLSFDPMHFDTLAKGDPKKAADLLRQLVGLDTSELEAEEKQLREERTAVGREKKKLCAHADSLPYYDDAPEEFVSVAELAAELERRQSVNSENEQRRIWLQRMRDQGQQILDRIAQLEEALTAERAKLEQTRTEGKALADEVAELKDEETDEILSQMKSAEADNNKLRANQVQVSADEKAKIETENWDALTERIEATAAKIAERTAAVKYPIEGLEVTADAVRLDGQPWSQASMSRRIRASTAIGWAQNPELKLLLIEGGAYLDEKNLTLIAELAEKAGGVALIEVVGEGGASVVIQDGEIKS